MTLLNGQQNLGRVAHQHPLSVTARTDKAAGHFLRQADKYGFRKSVANNLMKPAEKSGASTTGTSD